MKKGPILFVSRCGVDELAGAPVTNNILKNISDILKMWHQAPKTSMKPSGAPLIYYGRPTLCLRCREGQVNFTVDRFISADVYNEFLCRLSPKTTLTVWQLGSVFTKME